MSHWVCCNSCFLSQSPERKLAVTSCGHVVCSVCYQKGSHGRCVICSAQCQVSPLSDKSSPDIKDLFSDLGAVATRYLTEISKVVIFQARHQKRLMDYYKQRNKKVEELLVKTKQEMQQMSKTLSDQSAYIATLENALQHRSEPMDGDGRSLFRKPNSVPRPSVKKPQEGRMGSISCRPYNQSPLSTHCVQSATVSRSPTTSPTPELFSQSSGWKSPVFRPASSFRLSMSSLSFCP
ncbi:probable E3 SUMO-protein ligase RNF212 isoform X2 [Fundulus heteroclitus]|uniref:probable E3 SUMO-protein ligase RNF212 isoform X2 n=1 Tax=Fundulus heteroclitus TaxID=8078 RepID=UPI00165ABAAC|nr:probable E3 SUMO-protein ligase RNF212 isoform X2 [Fundulus heteroclitus]